MVTGAVKPGKILPRSGGARINSHALVTHSAPHSKNPISLKSSVARTQPGASSKALRSVPPLISAATPFRPSLSSHLPAFVFFGALIFALVAAIPGLSDRVSQVLSQVLSQGISSSYFDIQSRFLPGLSSDATPDEELIPLELLEQTTFAYNYGDKWLRSAKKRTVRHSVGAPPILSEHNESVGSKSGKSSGVEESALLKPAQPTYDLYGPKVVQKVQQVIKIHAGAGVDITHLSRLIVAEAERQQYDPLFVAAVIKTESSFHSGATSHVGATGLMQIMPNTKKYIETFDELRNIPRGALSEPEYNLRLGITYLRYLEKMFKGNRVLMLVAYNWGPGYLTMTVNGKKAGVPRSVVNYALKILSDHSRWQEEVV